MPIALNTIVFLGLAALLLSRVTQQPPTVSVVRRIIAADLLTTFMLPIGVWQAILYLTAKKHWLTASYGESFVQIAKDHLPFTVSQMAVELVFLALAIVVAGILRTGRSEVPPSGEDDP